MFFALDFRDQHQSLGQTDMINNAELKLRLILLAGPILAAYWAYDFVAPVFWFGIYCLFLIVMHSLTQAARRRYNRTLFIAAAWFNFLTAIVFISLPVILWLTDENIFRVAALALSFGALMHSIAHRSALPAFAVGDAFANCIFLFVVLWSTIVEVSDLIERMIIFSMALSIMVYYLIALISAFRVRHSLRAATEQTAEVQKMRLVGQLTGGVAHDFNNILTVVMGNLELYGAIKNPVERAKLVDEAYVAAEKASVLTSQLLSFSRQARLSPAPLNLSTFVESFWTMVAPILPKNVETKVEFSEDLFSIYVDSHQLETALLNLIINAKDAMKSGGKLRLKGKNINLTTGNSWGLKTGLPAGDYVAVQVIDTGGGVPWKIRDRVFDPFFTTKAVGEGSGLGLSMAKGFAEQSNGALILESREGRGTQITLVLPIVETLDVSVPRPNLDQSSQLLTDLVSRNS